MGKRKRATSRRRHNVFVCGGKCNKAGCTYLGSERADLTNHINAGLGIRPYACMFCESRFRRKFDRTSHVRRQHKEKVNEDGSCIEMNISARKKSPIKMPCRYIVHGIQQHEYTFLTRLVKNCFENDKKKFDASQILPSDNASRHTYVQHILDVLIERDLMNQGLDDTGLCWPLVLRPHSGLHQLSLDRKKNDLPHFIRDRGILDNLNLISLALNHKTNPMNRFGVGLRDEMRRRRGSLSPRTHEEVEKQYARESKSGFKSKDGSKWINNAAYSSCMSAFHGDKKKGIENGFESLSELFKYALDLLREQRFHCAISRIHMESRIEGIRHNPFQMSLDAIEPIKGHSRGNLRWVIGMLNNVNCEKQKKHVDATDHEHPGSWTADIFKRVFRL